MVIPTRIGEVGDSASATGESVLVVSVEVVHKKDDLM